MSRRWVENLRSRPAKMSMHFWAVMTLLLPRLNPDSTNASRFGIKNYIDYFVDCILINFHKVLNFGSIDLHSSQSSLARIDAWLEASIKPWKLENTVSSEKLLLTISNGLYPWNILYWNSGVMLICFLMWCLLCPAKEVGRFVRLIDWLWSYTKAYFITRDQSVSSMTHYSQINFHKMDD